MITSRGALQAAFDSKLGRMHILFMQHYSTVIALFFFKKKSWSAGEISSSAYWIRLFKDSEGVSMMTNMYIWMEIKDE